MTPEDFVKNFAKEREWYLKEYFGKAHENGKGLLIHSLLLELNLDEAQMAKIHQIIGMVITDIMYTVLLGLDGCAQIGGVQEDFIIHDQDGNQLTGGIIEGYAYEYFHGDSKK